MKIREVTDIYGKLPAEDLQAIAEAKAGQIGEAVSFAFECADIENWETMAEAIEDAKQTYADLESLLEFTLFVLKERAREQGLRDGTPSK